ncbi:MAG: fibronectin type III domain-containing protein [Bacteroidales bacterium]|nr:fibronectin type III domain-containing protein [Bacteroidales bacterium]
MDELSRAEGDFSVISINGYIPSENPGAPQLPVLCKMLQTPVCDSVIATVINAQYTEYDAADLGITHPLYPSQPEVSKKERPQFAYNQTIYRTNLYYGLPLVSAELAGIKRSYMLANVRVSPVQYNPVTQKVRVYSQIDVEFTFVNASLSKTNRLRAYESPMFQLDNNIVINELSSTRDEISTLPIKYLIIAHSMFRGNTNLSSFITWKRRLGYLVEVAYTDDSNVGTSTTSIKNFIQNKYDNATAEDPAPTFLLLIGDVAQIPSFSSQNGGNGDTDHVTDLYYATLSGYDYLPDCYYGRLSATNNDHLNNQLNKIMQYEQYTMPNPSYLGKAVLIAGNDDNGHSPTHANGQINYIYNNYINPYSLTHDYTTVYKHLFDCSSQASTIRSEIGAGVGFANYTAHGSSSGWAEPAFKTSHISDMSNTNKYGLMIGNCCLSGKFNDDECFAEALLRKYGDKGAMAYIGASNSSYWGPDVYWSVGACVIPSGIDYASSSLGAYDKLFHTHGEAHSDWVSTIGGIVQGGNMSVQSYGSSYRHYYWEIYHCFGDPSVRVYLGIPNEMTVVADDTISIVEDTYYADVPPYAYVALKKNTTEFVAAGFANGNGKVAMPLPSSRTAGLYELVVMAQNYIPYFQNVFITDEDICVRPRNVECTISNATTVSLSWIQMAGTADNWVVQYGTNPNFSGGTYHEVAVSGITTIPLSEIIAETTYYVRVKAICGGSIGESKWSNLCTFITSSEYTMSLGSATSTSSYLPTNADRQYSLTQQIYTAEELGPSGTIRAIALYKDYYSSTSRDLDIYMVNTGKDSFTSGNDWVSVTSADKVFSGRVSFNNYNWTTITLDTPFDYDGTSNLLLVVDDNTNSADGSAFFRIYSTGSSNQSIYSYSENIDYNPASPSSYSGSLETYKDILRLYMTCGKPELLFASNVSYFSADLSWTGGAQSYNVQIKTGNGEWTTVAANLTSENYSLTNLIDGTSYQVRVQSVCEGNVSNWVTTSFSTYVACLIPTALNGTLSRYECHLDWIEHGTSTRWVLQYGTDNSFEEGSYTEVVVTGTPKLTLTNLTPNVTYYARVKVDCGDYFGESRWSTVYEFVPSDNVTYCEDFEDYTATDSYYTRGFIPKGWNVVFTGSEMHYSPHIVTWPLGSVYNANNRLRLTSGVADCGSDNYVILRAYDGDPMSISFKYRYEDATRGALYFGYMTDETDQNTFVALENVQPNSSQDTELNYQLTSYNIPEGARLAFHWSNDYSVYSCVIDDICVVYGVHPCRVPSQLHPTSIDTSSVTLNWTGFADNYEMRYRMITDTSDGEWHTTASTTDFVSITGLIPRTQYEWQVRSVGCDEGVGTTDWSEVATFTTKADPIVYQIVNTVSDPAIQMTWEQFANRVLDSVFYPFDTILLMEDISVDTMVASADAPFISVFDGQGHTITIDYTATASDFTAPFRCIDGAEFKDLRVTGTINMGNNKFGAGFAGDCYGDNSFTNCVSDVTIISAVDGDGTHGGFIARNYGGTTYKTTSFTGCSFTGRLLGPNTTKCGGFCGWNENYDPHRALVKFTNCLFIPEEVTMSTSGSSTFSRSRYPSDINETNSYYSQSFGTEQGKEMFPVTTEAGVTMALQGDPTVYDLSGIAAYTTGIVYDDTLYAGNEESLTLILSGSSSGIYEADHGTVTGTENPYTLVMAASPAKISAIPCPIPSDLSIVSGSITNHSASLSWTGYSDSYNIQYRTTTGEWQTVSSTTNSVEMDGLTPNTYYEVQVQGICGEYGSSEWSGTKTFTTDQVYRAFQIVNTVSDSTVQMTWEQFVTRVNNGDFLATDTIALMEDISVSTMAGLYLKFFRSTFDGKGHTLTFNYTATEEYVAPFRYIRGATIKNLTVDGTINMGNYKFGGGFAGDCYGQNHFINCVSDVTIEATKAGDGTHGGFVAKSPGTTYTGIYICKITFTGCAFTGKLLGDGTSHCGGFCGWSEYQMSSSKYAEIEFNDCVFAPEEVTMNTDGCATFSRYRNSSHVTVNNSYYTQTFGEAQGKKMYSVTGADGVTVARTGNPMVYNVSRIQASSTGLVYKDTIYAGAGEALPLILTGGNTYAADHGTLTGTGNPYALTLEAYNTVISDTTPVSVIKGVTRTGQTGLVGQDAPFVNRNGQIVPAPALSPSGEILDE